MSRWKLIPALPVTILIPALATGIVFLVIEGPVSEPLRFVLLVTSMSLPLNALMALLVIISPRQKQFPEGCCAKCGYDLRYLDGCPECGWGYKK